MGERNSRNSEAKKREKMNGEDNSLRIHTHPLSVFVYEAPQDVLGGLGDVGPAVVFGEVAFEGDLCGWGLASAFEPVRTREKVLI